MCVCNIRIRPCAACLLNARQCPKWRAWRQTRARRCPKWRGARVCVLAGERATIRATIRHNKLVYSMGQTLCWSQRTSAGPALPEPRARERETPLCFVLMAQKRSIEIDHVNAVDDSLWPAEHPRLVKSGWRRRFDSERHRAMRCDAMRFARKVLWRQGTDECACATSVLELAPRVAKSATLSKMARVAADESAQRCPKRGEGRGGGQRCGDIARKMVYNWRQTLVDHRGDALATGAPSEPPQPRARERDPCVLF